MRSACRCPASRYCEYTHNIRDFAFFGGGISTRSIRPVCPRWMSCGKTAFSWKPTDSRVIYI